MAMFGSGPSLRAPCKRTDAVDDCKELFREKPIASPKWFGNAAPREVRGSADVGTWRKPAESPPTATRFSRIGVDPSLAARSSSLRVLDFS